MCTFQTLGVKKIKRPFEGKKVNINDLVGKPITILDFEIRDSKKKADTKYVRMQISLDGTKLYVNTGSKYLMEILSQITVEDLPIETEVLNNRGFYFKGTIEE